MWNHTNKRMHSPFSSSLRKRQSSRAALAATAIVLLIFLLNELRCARYGCVSRTGFKPGFADKTNSNSVIENAVGKAGEYATTIGQGKEGHGEGEGSAMEAKTKGMPMGIEDEGPFAVPEKENYRESDLVMPGEAITREGEGRNGVEYLKDNANKNVAEEARPGSGADGDVVAGTHSAEQNMGLGMGMVLGPLDGT